MPFAIQDKRSGQYPPPNPPLLATIRLSLKHKQSVGITTRLSLLIKSQN